MILLKKLWASLESPLAQYLIGAFINVLCVSVLMSNNTSYQNLQLPEGIYSHNRWHGGDVLTYVYPARNFLHVQVFGVGTLPDFSRTIGYPLFLSGLMAVFGDKWLMSAFFLQALIFASIYPVLSRTSKILFDGHFNSYQDIDKLSFIFFIVSGTYIAMVPVIMTDLFFSVFFMIGLYFGFEAVIRKSWLYLLLHIIFLAYAAQVRPVLTFFPIISFLILIYMSKEGLLSVSRKVYTMLMISVISLMILCNLPSIRNYMNHGLLAPSDIFYRGLFNCLAHDVLRNAGRIDTYNELQESINRVTNINEKIKVQQEFALKVYKDYPFITLAQIAKNAAGILMRSHWPIITNFWGYNFKENPAGSMPLQRSTFVFILEVFFNAVYLIIYILFLTFLVRHLRSGDFMFVVAILIFVAYLLIPTFMISGAGSRYRLPVEGIIVLVSISELRYCIEKRRSIFYTFRK